MNMKTQDAEAAAVAKTPSRVTLEHILAKIGDEQYHQLGPHGQLTLCVMTMKNGYVIVGKSAPADPKNFDAELGRRFAREDCLRQLWPLEGYLLCEQLRRDKLANASLTDEVP